MTYGRSLLVFSAVAAVSLASLPAQPARADGLAGHEAIYSVQLGRTSASSQIIGINGASMVRFEHACDGWIGSERLKMTMQTLAGGQITRDDRFTGWESLDGRHYKFVSRSRANGGDESYQGTATLGADLAGKATFTQPEKKTIALPKGTRFYTGFTRWILAMAKSGHKFSQTVSFDGADGDGPQRVTLFVTKAKPEHRKRPDLGALGKAQAYIAQMAFYDIGSQAEAPAFEIRARVLANGVTTRFTIDFSDFSIIEDIQRIEAVPPGKC